MVWGAGSVAGGGEREGSGLPSGEGIGGFWGSGRRTNIPSGNSSGLSQEPNLLVFSLYDSQVGNVRENLPLDLYSGLAGSFIFPTDTAQRDVNSGPYICT